MTSRLARRSHRSRRHVAAVNFLSNISLDGSHRDTKYAIFNKENFKCPWTKPKKNQQDSSEHNAEVRCDDEYECDDELTDSEETISAPITVDTNMHIKIESNNDQRDENKTPVACQSPLDLTLNERSLAELHHSSEERDNFTVSEEQKRHNSFSTSREGSVGVSFKKRLFRQHSVSESNHSMNCDYYYQGAWRRRHSSSSSWTSTSSSPVKEIRLLSSASDHPYLRNDRTIFLTSKKAPFCCFSVLSYNKKREETMSKGEKVLIEGRKRHISTQKLDGFEILVTLGVDPSAEEEISFANYLVPKRHRPSLIKRNTSNDSHFESDTCLLYNPGRSNVDSLDSEDPECVIYDAHLLDDPELIAGRHRATLKFSSYLTSVIDYVKPSDLKSELNEKFRQKWPNVDITLSKLRSLKREIRRIASDNELDDFTVAQSYVYFEKVILLGFLHKPNRKHVAGACLVLSAKLNDVKGEQLRKLLDDIADRFRLNTKDILAYEFPVLLGLKFELHVPDWEVNAQCQRILYES